MKGIWQVIVAIVACVGLCGCFGVSKQQTMKEAKNTKNRALQTCYQFSGASETKYATSYRDYRDKTTNKIKQIAKAKALKDTNKQQQINQCLKSLDEINTRLGQCNDSDFDCIGKVDEVYIAFIESIKPKLKDVKFSCSHQDEMLKKYGPKFDKELEQYALDLIGLKISVKYIDQMCVYKMQFYTGDLDKLDGFKKAGTLASSIYQNYVDFISQINERIGQNKNYKLTSGVIALIPDYNYYYDLSAKTFAYIDDNTLLYNDTFFNGKWEGVDIIEQNKAIMEFLKED